MPRPTGGLLALSQDYYVVRANSGDTYMSIAWEHNVSPYEVISLNQVRAPYRLQPGELVRIPTPRVHVVLRGETLSGIARTYRVSFYDLAQANALNTPYTIYPGQVLVLPARRPVFEKRRHNPVYAGAPTPAPDPDRAVPAPKPAWTSRQARAFPPPADPGGGREAPLAAPADDLPRPRPKPETVAEGPRPRPKPETVAETPRPTESLMWPVSGPVILEFGPTVNGRRNDGINIGVPEDTPVRAAAAGVVIYRGNEVPGFGNLILIRHGGELVTAYAHVGEIVVSKGRHVYRGEKIALSGSTGNVEEPQLHFEVRRGVKAVDPLAYLRERPAERRRASLE